MLLYLLWRMHNTITVIKTATPIATTGKAIHRSFKPR